MIPRLVRLIPYSYLSNFIVFSKIAVLSRQERQTVRQSGFLVKGSVNLGFDNIKDRFYSLQYFNVAKRLDYIINFF